MTIKGLESSNGMALNKKTGEIGNYDPSRKRWTVTVDGLSRSIKAENLELNDPRSICFLTLDTRSELWTRARQKGGPIAGVFGVLLAVLSSSSCSNISASSDTSPLESTGTTRTTGRGDAGSEELSAICVYGNPDELTEKGIHKLFSQIRSMGAPDAFIEVAQKTVYSKLMMSKFSLKQQDQIDQARLKFEETLSLGVELKPGSIALEKALDSALNALQMHIEVFGRDHLEVARSFLSDS